MMKMNRATILLAALFIVCTAYPVYALSTGGPGGKWPDSWPKELEPLRKQSWTWQGPVFDSTSYDIPFANRKEFESAWPHLLKLKSKGASIILMRGPYVRVKSGKTAGVRIMLPLKGVPKGSLSVTRIMLIVDGNIVDLNRIPLPPDTPIIDRRFSDK